MSEPDKNVSLAAQKLAQLQQRQPNPFIVQQMLSGAEAIIVQRPSGLVGGIDSSDNLLLQIPDHPGAAIAGYSFSLVISEPEGQLRYVQERSAEKEPTGNTEALEIAIVYSSPLPDHRRKLHISDYQLRVVMNTPSTQSPYNLDEPPSEFKVRLVAARYRETTERRAVRTSLFQSSSVFNLLLKDGRHSSQNVSPRYTDDVGRRAVERGIRYVGVVKQGTLLWALLYPYHRALFDEAKAPYWTLVAPELIWEAYASNQVQPKTLRLGAQENRALGGIGGAWVMYGSGPRTFYVLEFNVYDLAEYRPLVEEGMPLEYYNKVVHGWEQTYVVENRGHEFVGTQTRVTTQDVERLIVPTIGEIHYLSQASFTSPGYPIVLADAHNRCKITRDRKDQLNARLISELQRQGFHPVDFETWNEDPHKVFEG